jgi:ABC-type polysaccharide/polyol phosphate transport system ATPase subunit
MEQLIRRWCKKAVLFEKGQCIGAGSVDAVLSHYHENLAQERMVRTVELVPVEITFPGS